MTVSRKRLEGVYTLAVCCSKHARFAQEAQATFKFIASLLQRAAGNTPLKARPCEDIDALLNGDTEIAGDDTQQGTVAT